MWLIVYPCGDFPTCWLTFEDSLIFAARLTNNISISTPKHQVLSMAKWTSLHYTYKRLPCLAYQAFHNLALDDINNLFTKRGTPCNLRNDLRLELVCSKSKALYVSFTHRATTSCESTWDTVPYFGIYIWPVHDLVLVISPPPLIKVSSNTRPYSKLGGTTLNGRKEGGQYYISQTCDQERFEARKVVFSWECLNILQ